MKILFLMFFISVIHAWKPISLEKDMSKLFGVWYVNAWTGNVDIPEDKRHQKIPPFTVRLLSNGKLEAKLNLKKYGRCEEIKLTLEKTKEPGKMTTWGRQLVGLLSIYLEDQKIVYIESRMNGKNVIMMLLAGRNKVAHPEALKIFTEFVRSKGQDETKIIIPGLEGNKDGFSNFS
ncbi:odorant-binding protein 2b-like [Vombatus ursinus]|uniref:odorant-binding protein 2b-like n=1 Tax=Vombatus ursinus TaxID=29139 RepID=UPI000FFD6613|nr:odorant-binding protein 2b-like [Vombatus ursinus]